MSESRSELLHWLNSLLQLNITKIEQCGTGAAFCQVFDSIYLDIPMSRVKFSVNTEYAYINNFKILQNCMTRHAIDRTVPVTALVKCKMQDNLEFLQWVKKHWDQNFPGHDYDALARRKAAGIASTGPPAAAASSSRSSTGAGTARKSGPSASTGHGVSRIGAGAVGAGAGGAGASLALRQENETLKEAVGGLEKERDFYFSKLRDIELLVQTAIEQDPELDKEDNGLLKNIQNILYSTEEGFEIPNEGEFAGEPNGEEQETF